MTINKEITIVIVDDHKMIREMWRLLFEGHPTIKIVGESATAENVPVAISIYKPTLVLLDINLHDKSGIDLIPLIKEISPGTKVIGVSMHNRPSYAQKMIASGASGYLTKNSPQEEVFLAIDSVLNGHIYVCSEIETVSQLNKNSKDRKGLNLLSPKELEIVDLIKVGDSSKQISDKLSISVRTVESHRYNILKKLDIKNVAALINFLKSEDPTF